ncbi:hypothetical protein BDV27DRAFT_153141 [Aspergillus caelatus]|uniref:Uncharacterized protein n=1 Tax=Aspergillus caelatus TaxID=61420 RepID=A0A5N7AHA6_9EURO|nr:uncharacterized protein BDV27DRAFT_153141 [Aspergillus caelatus]KAE8369261.1 hypothetical protein BDV27DRAFT_153141 [Aspergillus caelatus]
MTSASLQTEARDGTLTRTSLKDYLKLVDIDVLDDRGNTALSMAIRHGHVGAVKLLLQSGADPNRKIWDGRAPLYLVSFANDNRARIGQLLIEHGAKVNESLTEWGNETALMAAITHARDPELVQLLVEKGASTAAKNDRGETANDLARQSTNPNMSRAVLPKDQQGNFLPGLSQVLANAGMLALNFFPQYKDAIQNAYKDVATYSNQQANPSQKKDIEEPKTEDDFKLVLLNFVEDTGLEDFYPANSPTVAAVARNAVALQNDPTNIFTTASAITTLAMAALYRPIFYCDDSGSMDPTVNKKKEDRWSSLKTVVKEMAEVITKLKEPGRRKADLRFINTPQNGGNDIPSDQLTDHFNFNPRGGTELGGKLKANVLDAYIYDPINSGKSLAEPLLIITITDGCPEGGTETVDTFRNVVQDCATWVVDPSRGYDKKAVKHSLNQIGTDEKSKEFLQGLIDNPVADDVLHVAVEQLDVNPDFRDNYQQRLTWENLEKESLGQIFRGRLQKWLIDHLAWVSSA